jgi:hypothetical protein
MIDEKSITRRFAAVGPSLDDRTGRFYVAAEVRRIGHGAVVLGTIGRGLNHPGTIDAQASASVRCPPV